MTPAMIARWIPALLHICIGAGVIILAAAVLWMLLEAYYGPRDEDSDDDEDW